MSTDILNEVTQNDYKYGFTTDIETDIIPIGLSEDVVRLISKKKNEVARRIYSFFCVVRILCEFVCALE